MRQTAVILEFEAENAGRWNTHRHLFLLPDQVAESIDGPPAASLSVGSIPLDDWVQYLEQGSQEPAGSSGWGTIRNPHLVWGLRGQKAI